MISRSIASIVSVLLFTVSIISVINRYYVNLVVCFKRSITISSTFLSIVLFSPGIREMTELSKL